MDALLVSTGIIALAELGDKTQLLAFLLAVRFKRFWPVIAGITLATVLNHAFAGVIGIWLAKYVPSHVLGWMLGLSFLAMALWALQPDTLESDESAKYSDMGAFGTTFAVFFLAEMGDKTQIATAALAAQYSNLPMVVIGTTLGMLVADVPAVLAADRLAQRIPLKLVRRLAALAFAVLGVWVLCFQSGVLA